MLAREDGGDDMEWALANPSTFLTQTSSNVPHYQMIVEQALQRFPYSAARPWDFTIAIDELVPGNQFDSGNGRKTMVLFFVVLELGRAAFADPRAWMAPITVRASIIVAAAGGWSACSART